MGEAVRVIEGGQHSFTQSRWLGVPVLQFAVIDLLLVAMSAADILFTWAVLSRGGEEMNPIAKIVLDAWEFGGLIAYKYALIVFAIYLCEKVGQRRAGLGRFVLAAGVALTAVPVVWSIGLLSGAAH